MNHLNRSAAEGPQLRTLLLTDLVDSTGLVERLGDVKAAALFRQHDRLVLELQQQWRGRLIDRSDGLLLLFERPVDGLGFALDYTRGLQRMAQERGIELQARAGLHVGEVLTWKNSDAAVQVGAKPLEVEGLAKPMAARLMSLARPGQILLSAVAESLTHRAARELGERGQNLLWKSHGRWRFKGVPEAQEIFEVGEVGVAPLRAPGNIAKAWRDIPLWRRPAMLAAEVLLVAGLGIGTWFLTRPQPAIAFSERDWVVVGDLRNLTGQKVLDDSLAQAFRISLEQSRYVNVLSDMKARDTLARMQRKPGTLLDRAIASEIAIRDGARAVILPTVSEIGGKVRFSAEVVDPHTQTTVYAESADGTGAGSALESIGKVTAALRGKLGEALASIEKDSAPLPQVTTANLDALRTYALGIQAYSQRRSPEALRFFERAVQLDPDFALAYMGLMRVNLSNTDADRAKEYLGKALALRERLPQRDAMYLDAWSAELGSHASRDAPAQWKMLADIFPDYYAAHYNYAWGAFTSNQFDQAARHARVATAKQEPMRSAAYELLGRVDLAQGKYEEALAGLAEAEKIGGYGPNRRRVAALAVMKRFSEAQALLKQLPSGTQNPGNLTNELERIAIAVDQADFQQALSLSAEAMGTAGSASPLLANVFSFVSLSVQAQQATGGASTAKLAELAQTAYARAADAKAADRVDQLFISLATVYLSQRQGDKTLADSLVPQLSRLVQESEDPMSLQMLAIVEATQERLAGNAAAAVARLLPLVDGTELVQLRVALRAAFADLDNRQGMQAQDRWLAAHRGRAYIEAAGGQVLQAMNIADVNAAAAALEQTPKITTGSVSPGHTASPNRSQAR